MSKKKTIYHFRGQRIKSVSEMPQKSHLAVIVEKKKIFNINGDKKSETNPGHGYPERTEVVEYFEYYAFKEDEQNDLQTLVELFLNENPQRNDLIIMRVDPIPHKVSFVVDLGIQKTESKTELVETEDSKDIEEEVKKEE